MTMTMVPARIPKLTQNLCFTTTLSTPPSNSASLLSFTNNHHQYSRIKNRFVNYSNAPNTTNTPPTISTTDDTEDEEEEDVVEEFDWYAQWYPVMPVSDLDKRKPRGKRVIGLDVVVWWDKNESQWKVFNDLCPHRLAPLSEGRIDQWGRLQCVYHGWCFDASGQCKLIPQAPTDGPPVHTSKKACVAVYPTVVQNNMVWFWPNSDPQYKDILLKKKPPFLPVLDDPSYTNVFSNRDINYGYEILMENLMDPSHVPYAHYGILKTPAPKLKADREGGRPLNLSVNDMDMNGFSTKQDWGSGKFIAPCIYYAYSDPPSDNNSNGSVSSTVKNNKKVVEQIFKRSTELGFQIQWGSSSPTPPREELLDRYWTHVVNCSSCNAAYKGLNIAETVLQVIAFGLIGVVGLAKQGMMTTIQRTAVFTVAILCFAASKWLSHFIYKYFCFHDYNHAFR